MSAVLTAMDGGVFTVTLNRPDKRNALSTEMVEQLHEALDRADLDTEVRVVLLRGAGKDFCAGADLDELLASADRPAEENEKSALRLGSLFQRIRELPKPVMAMVHGRALAGGAGLATACDLVLLSKSAQIGYPEIQRGFVPAMVMTLLRRMAGEKLAMDLVLTGRTLAADEALAAGLVSRVLLDTDLERETAAVAARLAASSPSALALTKKLLYQLDGCGISDGIALGARVNAMARGMPDFREALVRFLGK